MKSKELSIYPIESVRANGLNYGYIRQGQGDVVFFLHGFPDLAGTWDETITRLSKNFTCIAPFLRGYYPSDIPKNKDYSVKSIAADINQIAENFRIEKYSVVGHDWGGSVAYVMANMFSEKINKVCVEGIPHPRFLKPSLKLLFKARHILYFLNQKKAVKRLTKNNFSYLEKLYKRWSPNWENYKTLQRQMIRYFDSPEKVEAALSYYWQLGKDQKDNKLIQLYQKLPEKPLLTIVGEKDGTVDLRQFKKMEKEMPSEFQLISHPTAGHFVHREEYDFFANTLIEFLRR